MSKDSREEAELAMKLAIGRLFRMGSRTTQEGDIAMYYKCRDIVMEAAEVLGISADTYQHSYARDHNKGAAGD